VVPESADRLQLLVASGSAQLDEVITIVDPETLCPLAADRIGEIWVRGSNIARGYWAQPDETSAVFNAYLAGTTDGPYLRTGDLGFVREGQLFVTGRLKDLILIRGRNFYPQDIELTVETSHSDLRLGCSAAFSCDADNEEHLVVVQEVRENAAADFRVISAAIRLAVKRAHGVEPRAIVLVASRSVIKTSSGKIARRACRDAYAHQELSTLFEWRESRLPAPHNPFRFAAPTASWVLGNKSSSTP
jgi:acyl-CoA synthetase (AMP-forming)/AMP-acid ligase II